jgi:hypothetical protein
LESPRNGLPALTLLLRWELSDPPASASAASPMWGPDPTVRYRVHLISGRWVTMQGDAAIGRPMPTATLATWRCSLHALAELVTISETSPCFDERKRSRGLLNRLSRLAEKTSVLEAMNATERKFQGRRKRGRRGRRRPAVTGSSVAAPAPVPLAAASTGSN